MVKDNAFCGHLYNSTFNWGYIYIYIYMTISLEKLQANLSVKNRISLCTYIKFRLTYSLSKLGPIFYACNFRSSTAFASSYDLFSFYITIPRILTSALFQDTKQRVIVIPYRRFGTTYRSPLQWYRIHDPRKLDPIVCTETSVRSYHY
jgi:hypothetical protein